MPTNVKNFFQGLQIFYPLKIYSYIPNAMLWIRKEFFRARIHNTFKKATFYSPAYMYVTKKLCHSCNIFTYFTSYNGKVFVVTGTGGIQQKRYRQRTEEKNSCFSLSNSTYNLPSAIICPTFFETRFNECRFRPRLFYEKNSENLSKS